MGFGIVDKLLDQMERRGVRHKHEMGKPGDKRDRRKIRNRIVAQRAVETGVHRKGPAVEQDCVSVGIGRAAYSLPMLVPAPALFSMNTVLPHIAESFSARIRATISVGPPAATDTMMRTDFVGYPAFDVCARAASGHATAAPPSNVMNSRLFTQSPRRRGQAESSGFRGRASWRFAD